MRIGLVRHFRVDCPHQYLMTDEEFREWIEAYDCSVIRIADMTVDTSRWEKCYCSDLPRAVATARHIYNGSISQSVLLREVPISPVCTSRIKLPYVLWLVSGRLAWLFSHRSQPETIKQTKDRVKRFVADIKTKPETSVLVVTHGFLMLQIQKELKAQGFRGDNFTAAKSGTIYVFENDKC
ncbi:histidine phosphatase family protein [Sporomusa sp.]|uniref:histidine phosphatase family protein n=1 Tax=Sporomusa sp. TaxID=2078658 RepID=UPI002CEB7EE6|nr:histidine phosphatase family protein [Sporomusa sp.]HWR42076.1 histidine phosphatase family protein [Sporomusa sp.]